MANRATPPTSPHGVLNIVPAPPDLRFVVRAFVRRIDAGVGVVRILPEVRASLQVQAADPYWIREQGSGSGWRRTPRVAAWGPRHRWGWGYSRGEISAFAVLLTAAAFASLAGRPASTVVNRVLALRDLAPDLAAALDAAPNEDFDAWVARATRAVRMAFQDRPLAEDPVAGSLPILATAEENVITRAGRLCGLSERHFRRRFRDLHGASPKLYQRLIRVDRKLRELHAMPWEADDWAGEPIAFADQPHLIREFRALTGLTPRQYAQAKAAGDATLRSVANLPGAPAEPDA